MTPDDLLTPPAADRLELSGGAPVVLPNLPRIWEVERGSAEIYLLWPEGRRFLCVAGIGDWVFGLAPDANADIQIIAPDGVLLSPTALDGTTLVDAARHWISTTSDGLTSLTETEHAVLDEIRHAEITHETALPVVAAYSDALVGLHAGQLQRADRQDLARLGAAPQQDDDREQPAQRVRHQIAAALGLKPETLPGLPQGAGVFSVPVLVRMMGLRARPVVLEPDWLHSDQGPLIARQRSDEALVALRWTGRAYADDRGHEIGREDAEAIRSDAYAISRSLPAEVTGLWSLAFHVILSGNRRDAVMAGLAAMGIAGLGILVPLATGWLLSDIVPAGIGGLLIAVGIALTCAALITSALGTARALATLRIDGRGASILNAGLTDRLLRLPTRFFKRFPAGDLNQRLENVEQMRQLGVSILMSAGLTAVLSVVYLVVLFSYDLTLALIAAGLVTIYIGAVILVRVLQREPIREAAALDGEIAGLTFETLEGVAKLRSAAAEERAMDRWGSVYRRERETSIRAGRIATHFGAFADAYQTITLLVLFAGAGALASVDAPAGIFIGFLAAFGAFQGAFVGLSDALLQVYSAQPLVERAKPILEAEPEVDPGRSDPGQLSGAIEAAGLTFAYGEGLAPVLNNLDLKIAEGQHVAIVGGSGSGKSTLLRLLLGFESPLRGSILYNGQDLTRLDLTRVRGQIGVVLQASQLFAGSILENIRGAGNAGLEECLIAAERAGLAQDLEYFAMGIHTPITEGGSTLSGGQRQRILIARALASSPKMLFFDEATSALDNTTQAVVSGTLDAMKITRVTIAHRLSTVRNADLICVLEDGKFVEQGSYDMLMARDGAFAKLAQRQLAGE